MKPPSRSLLFAILVAVFVGHASLVAHATTHAGLEVADCEICVSYGDSPALAPAAGNAVVPSSETVAAVVRGAAIPAPGRSEFRQRGPPASY